MTDSTDDGWNDSAASWIAMGDGGDFSRKFVLDAPMLARIKGRGFETALDVGCGEGRFCRMLRDECDPETADRYRRVPYLYLMEWQKPAA